MLDKIGFRFCKRSNPPCYNGSISFGVDGIVGIQNHVDVRNGYLCDGCVFSFEKEWCLADQTLSEARVTGNSHRRLLMINKMYRDRLEEVITINKTIIVCVPIFLIIQESI